MMPDGDIVMYADSQLRFVASAVPLFKLAEAAGGCRRAQPTSSTYIQTQNASLTPTMFDSRVDELSENHCTTCVPGSPRHCSTLRMRSPLGS
jgi:hypothetical protein